ncbi:MAG: hypothetical protein K8R92_01055 [Planctomycetes bacterium]|nr:hypothetical protein [Planctomycetota bacterium]
MTPSEWDDLREDAREFSKTNPKMQHTLVFIPSQGVPGAQELLTASFDDARDIRSTLRLLGIPCPGDDEAGIKGLKMWHRHGHGSVHTLLWPIEPHTESSADWKRLWETLWGLIGSRVATVLPDAFAVGVSDAPTIENGASDPSWLLHWLAWPGHLNHRLAKVRWRVFPLKNGASMTLDERFPSGCPSKIFANRTKTELQHVLQQYGVRGSPLENSQLTDWWSSTIDAGPTLVAAIDWLRPRLSPKADGLPTGNEGRQLPELGPHDRQAWQLSMMQGMTQGKIAEALNKEHRKTYNQGQVSRMIARAKVHAEANGVDKLAEQVAGKIKRPMTVDPGRLNLGPRVDKRNPRPSDRARENDDD